MRPVLTKEVPADTSVAVRAPRPPGTATLQRLSIAVSDLGVFRSCPRRYDYQRRWHLPVRTDARDWYGTMIHEVLRSAATQRMAGVSVTGDSVAAMWQVAWEQSRGPKGRHADLRAHGEAQLRGYVESPGWTDTAIDHVEEPVMISLDHADVAGRFDRVDRRADGIPTVVDYKTGRPKDEAALRADLQLRAYAVGLAQREQTDDVAIEFHYLQGAVTRVIADKASCAERTAICLRRRASWRPRSSTGSFPPKPSRWQCQRCDFRTVCDEGRAALRGVSTEHGPGAGDEHHRVECRRHQSACGTCGPGQPAIVSPIANSAAMQSAIDSTIAAGLIGALTPKKTMLTATTKASVTTIKQVCTTICAASTQYAGPVSSR